MHTTVTHIGIELIMFGRQYDLLHVLGDARHSRQIDTIVCDSKQFMNHRLVCPLHAHNNSVLLFIIIIIIIFRPLVSIPKEFL